MSVFVKNVTVVTIVATVKSVQTAAVKTSKVCVTIYKITAIFAMDWRMSRLASAMFVMDVQLVLPSVDRTMVGIEEWSYVWKYDSTKLLNVNRENGIEGVNYCWNHPCYDQPWRPDFIRLVSTIWEDIPDVSRTILCLNIWCNIAK